MQKPHLRRFSPRTWTLGLAAMLVALGLGACGVRTDTQGNMVDAELLKQVKPGALTKEQVQTLLGTPSSVSTFDQTTWYYIGKQTQKIAFLDPSVLDQKVVAVEFDNKGVVKAIHQYGEADGKDVQHRLAHDADARQGDRRLRSAVAGVHRPDRHRQRHGRLLPRSLHETLAWHAAPPTGAPHRGRIPRSREPVPIDAPRAA